MVDTIRALDRIETAERDTPFCWCGEATAAFAHANHIALRCTSLAASKGVLHHLLTLDFPIQHVDAPIVDFVELHRAA